MWIDEVLDQVGRDAETERQAIAPRGSFTGAGTNFAPAELEQMAENWIDIEDQPEIIDAEVDDQMQQLEALEDDEADGADDDSEPEVAEMVAEAGDGDDDDDDDDDEFELLPDHDQAVTWIGLIQKAAPDLGVPDETVAQLEKVSLALRKAKTEKHSKDSSLHSFLKTLPKKRKWGGSEGDERGGDEGGEGGGQRPKSLNISQS